MKNYKKCTGCGICEKKCPKNAIRLVEDKNGFIYPKINKSACVKCGICDRICESVTERHDAGKFGVYAFQSNDELIQFYATSGGFIQSLSKIFLNKRGVVYGVSYAPNKNNGVWERIVTTDDLAKIAGSKYFQIPLSYELFSQIDNDLVDKEVLFIGTPCQVGAIRRLFKDCCNLTTVDIICGGVASFNLEKEYVQYIEKKNGSKIIERKFRSKKNGWGEDYLSIAVFENADEQVDLGGINLFTRGYISGKFMRESCYECDYVGRSREGDFTVGDCWGISNYDIQAIEVKKGVSLVLVNTEKAMRTINAISNGNLLLDIDKSIMLNNKPLNYKTKRPFLRNMSYDIIRFFPFKMGLNIVCYRYIIKKMYRQIKRSIINGK